MWPGRFPQLKSGAFPVPSNAKALWLSSHGVTLGAPGRVSQWTDQIGGRVLAQATASQRPVYGVDSGGAAGRAVIQAAVSGTKYLTALNLAPLAVVGQHAYIAAVSRQRALVASGIQTHWSVNGLESPVNLRAGHSLSARGDGAGNEYWYCHRNSQGSPTDVITGDVQDTLVHLWEFCASPSTGFSAYKDGGLVGVTNNASSRLALSSNHTNIGLGAGFDGSFSADASIDFLLECSATPTAAERAAMLAWACNYGGVALPEPRNILSGLVVEMDASKVVVESGKIASWLGPTTISQADAALRATLQTDSSFGGQPTAAFSAHEYPLPNLSAWTQGEVFAVLAVTADPPGSINSSGLWTFGGAAHYPYTNGIVYEDFGVTQAARYTCGDPGTSLTSAHVYNVRSATNDWANSINGTTLYTSASNTPSFPAGPAFGRAGNSAVRFAGRLAYLALCSQTQTLVQRADMIAYLKARFGIVA